MAVLWRCRASAKEDRVWIEHLFGLLEESMHGMSSRAVGFARNAAFNTLTTLVYNRCRYEQVMRLETD
jgi:hypothetical protein